MPIVLWMTDPKYKSDEIKFNDGIIGIVHFSGQPQEGLNSSIVNATILASKDDKGYYKLGDVLKVKEIDKKDGIRMFHVTFLVCNDEKRFRIKKDLANDIGLTECHDYRVGITKHTMLDTPNKLPV